MAEKPSKLMEMMVEVLKQFPEGLTSGELREKMNLAPSEQAQLDRRRRDLKLFYIIEKAKSGRHVRYIYRGDRAEPLVRTLNQKQKAQARHRARGRCGMCGKTIDHHGIVLVVDHKIPQDWGGTDDPENLWAICEECNAGKKNLSCAKTQSARLRVMMCQVLSQRVGIRELWAWRFAR